LANFRLGSYKKKECISVYNFPQKLLTGNPAFLTNCKSFTLNFQSDKYYYFKGEWEATLGILFFWCQEYFRGWGRDGEKYSCARFFIKQNFFYKN